MSALPATDFDPAAKLTALLVKYPYEREELLAAGVPERTVTALYPLDFAHLMAQVGDIAAASGMGHLNHDDSPEKAWLAQYDLLENIAKYLPPPLRTAYDQERHREIERWLWSDLRSAVSSRLNCLYWMAMATSLTTCYFNGFFMAYWLLQHGGEAEVKPHFAEQVMRWVAEKQLPSDS